MIVDTPDLIDELDMSDEYGALRIERPAAATSNQYHETSTPSVAVHMVRPWVAYSSDGDTLEQVPEANRSEEHLDVYSNSFVYRLNDVVVLFDHRWEIDHVDNYMPQGGVCFASAMKLPQ